MASKKATPIKKAPNKLTARERKLLDISSQKTHEEGSTPLMDLLEAETKAAPKKAAKLPKLVKKEGSWCFTLVFTSLIVDRFTVEINTNTSDKSKAEKACAEFVRKVKRLTNG